ncbi:glucuronokinase [Chloropicon primus]|uniref:Glucuronokinase n=1 Tax=Chloropicon primus TaxID=1764295 RepID=A0A5B8MTZ6_9CHLO|nr:glucuronokinase [Chloropicon primus]|mmetsp:Transcript_577/g.1666  ORF Transcript_577/g.1666 Transcript_577/m.1666 type:complete len:348 (+) Transcript_577:353-1396(+)|eukprot:QDZ22910.1 glucuronokinase [Chloropicon primus]
MEVAVIKEHAHARVGLLGNPSDIYHGKVIALSVSNFRASVTLKANESGGDEAIAVVPGERDANGGKGRVRLLESLLKLFYQHPGLEDVREENKLGFSLSYESSIPFQAGLSGSSAIICAALRCLVRYYNVGDRIDKAVLPNLVLAAENALGIVAGYMDRVIQVYGGAVFMDFAKEVFEAKGHGAYEELDPKVLPEHLYLMFPRPKAEAGSDEGGGESGKIHSNVRQRWLDGDEEAREAMRTFARLAEEGREVLLRGEGEPGKPFAEIMRANFKLRRSLFGDQVLGKANLDMVNLAESQGAAAKFTGSGGAIVVYCFEGEDQAAALGKRCDESGYTFLKIEVAEPSVW